jgi:3-oxoacyl-[acyl-carrier-protein] synthase II
MITREPYIPDEPAVQRPGQGRPRVVVTGLGVVSPLGIGAEVFWDALLRGSSGVGPITRFDANAHETRIAAEVKAFDPHEYMDRKEVKRTDAFIHYAVAAARLAMDDSGLKVRNGEAETVGVSLGTGMGGLAFLEQACRTLVERGPSRVGPYVIPGMIPNMAAGLVSMQVGARGPNLATSTACAASNHAIGEAFRLIQAGDAEVMLAGGSDALVTPLIVAGFSSLGALSRRNDEPTRASRPFDGGRDGFVIGDGAGILILEELEHALCRGARVYAEIVGYGQSADAYHITAPAPDASGPARSMERALENANLIPAAVDYINAHGTSTPANDANETAAIKRVFGPHARGLAISSTKSMTGHLMGAAGAVEAIATCLAIRHAIVPPTINYETPDPECDLDYVPNFPRPLKINAALSNAFGFGGTNATLAFQRFVG